MASSRLRSAIIRDEPQMDVAAAERDLLDAGDALVRQHPAVGAVASNAPT